MKFKIIFGIAIPLIAIIALAIVASYGSVKVDIDFIDELIVSEIMGDDGVKQSIRIGSLELSNDNSFTKKHELPMLGACLVDNDGDKQAIEAGTVDYSEGEYTRYDEVFLIESNSRGYRLVEVGSGKEKTVYAYLKPSYVFQRSNYTELVEQYGDYDEVVIYEKKKSNSYNSYYRTYCNNLGQDVTEDALHIDLVY